MTTDWKALCLEMAEQLAQCPIDYTRAELLLRVRKAAGLIGDEEAPLALLNLPTEMYNPLRRGGYDTIEQVEGAGPEPLMRISGLGPERVGQILSAVRKWRRENP
jgi:hypothetical protein